MSESTVDTQLQVGDVIAGKYRIDRVLGQGGMGLVVAATHEQLDQRVALKFLKAAIAMREDLVRRFMREARAAVKIQSEHVARVYDVGTHGVLPFMVMEYLEGADLAETLAARGQLTASDAAAYVIEACDAVAEAHALGIVHRDIKPANLFLANRARGNPIVKVLDFGISKAPSNEAEQVMTNATAIMGSPSYMSPEQMVASASVDARSDIWSLGVTLYELVTGALPFRAESMPELVGVILQGTYPPVSATRPDVPPELQAIVERCLQKDREHRFQSVGELARALLPLAPRHRALVERIDGMAAPPSVPKPPSTVGASSQQVPPENLTLSPTVHEMPRSKTPLWLAFASAVIFAIGMVVFAMTRHGASPAPASLQTASNSPAPSASAPAPTETHAEAPSATAAPTPEPSSAPVATHAHPAAHASAHAAPSASAAPCKKGLQVYFDADGNKHFREQTCP